jgi:hypothetical protein
MSLATNNLKTNIMARQNTYIRPRINPINQTFLIESSSDDAITPTDSSSNTNSIFSSNDSLSSFEDYRINVDLEENKYNKYNNISSMSECNRGFMSSICCSWWCARS